MYLLIMVDNLCVMFENRVLRRVFGPKRDEVTGEWRKLHNEELHDLYLWDVPQLATSQKLQVYATHTKTASVLPPEDGHLSPETRRGFKTQ
jgi:hypothetical protein